MTNAASHTKRLNWRAIGWGLGALLLLLPLVAMQFTREVNWTASDFLFAGMLVGALGLVIELAGRRTTDRTYRAAVGIAAITAFLLVWANGAVGLIGSETNDANALFHLVPIVALVGAVLTRARSAGMFLVMSVTAVAQVAAACAVLAISWQQRDSIWVRELVLTAGVFGAMWLGSAALFRQAAR